jgi:hemerythrin
MVEENAQLPGISSESLKKVWQDYLHPVGVKKIDIGGGLIHGKAIDFKNDKSDKIILAHTAQTLTQEEKVIGCGVSFGSSDTLIEGHEDYALEFGADYLRGYYPNVEIGEIHMLLNCERESINAGTILLRDQEIPKHVCLVLTGVAELLSPRDKTSYPLSSGTLIGDLAVIFGLKSTGTYRTLSHIETLKIPAVLFNEFVNRNHLLEQIHKTQETIEFLQQTWLFGESISSPIQSQIAQSITLKKYKKGEKIEYDGLMLVKKGKVELINRGANKKESLHEVGKGDFWGGEKMISSNSKCCDARAITPTDIYSITDVKILENIPIIRWKMLEQTERRE